VYSVNNKGCKHEATITKASTFAKCLFSSDVFLAVAAVAASALYHEKTIA